jgi:regulator of sigma E protease
VELDIERGEKNLRLSMVAKQPREPKETHPLVGIRIQAMPFNDMRVVYPTPMEQVVDSLDMMWATLSRLVSPKSNVGVDHLSGPVGIAKIQFRLLQMDDGWMRVLAFLVVFNVNLAVMNMLPIPVLDGGHIVLAILEKIAGRPVKAKFLEVMQTACAITLMGLMLYVTSKDVGEEFGSNKSDPSRVVFDPPVK